MNNSQTAGNLNRTSFNASTNIAIMLAVKFNNQPTNDQPNVETSTSKQKQTNEYSAYLYLIAEHKDKEAFEKLYWSFAPKIKTYMKRQGAEDQIAEELAQETLLTIWQKASYFNPEKSSPSTWIFRIARNLYIDRIRKRKFFESEPIESVEKELTDETTHFDDIDNERMLKVMKKELSDEQFTILKMTFFKGLNQSEISSTLSIPLGTVKSRLRLAYEKLRLVLGDRP